MPDPLPRSDPVELLLHIKTRVIKFESGLGVKALRYCEVVDTSHCTQINNILVKTIVGIYGFQVSLSVCKVIKTFNNNTAQRKPRYLAKIERDSTYLLLLENK